jgi:hypothetical protein
VRKCHIMSRYFFGTRDLLWSCRWLVILSSFNYLWCIDSAEAAVMHSNEITWCSPHIEVHAPPHTELNLCHLHCCPGCCICRRASGALLVRCAAARTRTHMCVRCTARSSTTTMSRPCWYFLFNGWKPLESC